MKIIIAVLAIASMSFASKLDSLDKMIDSLYQIDINTKAKANDSFSRYSNEYINEYKPHAERIMLKQYKSRFPQAVSNGDTTIYLMMENSKGTWFPNLLKLKDNSNICIIKSLFVMEYSKTMHWDSFLARYTYYRCAEKISNNFDYKYEKSAN